MYIVLEKVPEYRYPLCFEKFKNKSTKFSRPGYPGVLNLVPLGTKFSTPESRKNSKAGYILYEERLRGTAQKGCFCVRNGSATPREEGFAKQTQVMLLGRWCAEDVA